MSKIRTVLVATALAFAAATVTPAPNVSASAWSSCDYSNSGSSFMLRQSVVPNGPWIANATATISIAPNYPSLCTPDPNQAFLWASMSSSWIAIDHPFVACPPSSSFCNPGGSIVQAGFIKCSTSFECALSHIPPEFFYRNVTFFAIGNANDIFNTPSPWPMSPPGVFEDGSYTFKLVLHYNPDGTRDWWTYINGALYFIYTDMARNWTRDTAQTANEIWNVGDGLGGIAGLHQDFTGISWGNGTNHSGLASQPGLTGHCYPWAGFNPIPAPPATYHVFTNNNHTGATC